MAISKLRKELRTEGTYAITPSYPTLYGCRLVVVTRKK